MDWESLKQKIIQELESTINTIDPAFDIDHCLNIYFKILKFKINVPNKNNLDGLENTIEESLKAYFKDNRIDSILIGDFCKNFEPFVKKIYYILEEGDFVDKDYQLNPNKLEALTPFLSVLNKIKPIYLDNEGKDVTDVSFAKIDEGKPLKKLNPDSGHVLYERLYKSSLSFDKYVDVNDIELNTKFENSFLLYFLKAIILKNEQSHQNPSHSKAEEVANMNATLISELWIINFLKKELQSAFKTVNYRNKEVDEYIKGEINRLKNQNTKFVSLNLLELTSRNSEIGKKGFIENILGSNLNRLRILGQAGSGKTTTLEFLFYSDAVRWLENQKNSKLPVFISLSNILSQESILQNISKKINTDIHYVEELLETDELKLYLDGINEIVENRETKKLKLQEIASILEEYPKLTVILTDRYEFDSYQNNMFNIPTFIIQKINDDQIEEFVRKYCYNNEDQTQHVLEILNSKTKIKELLLRPLVLTRAIEIIKIDNDLPEMEGQIIEKFLDTLLKREKDEKKDPLLNINQFKLLLSFAANNIWFKNNRSNAPVHEFTFNKILVKGAEEFGLEKYNAGYVTRIGCELEILMKNDELIQFFHQSYIEFFVKHYLKYEVH